MWVKKVIGWHNWVGVIGSGGGASMLLVLRWMCRYISHVDVIGRRRNGGGTDRIYGGERGGICCIRDV